VARENTEEQGRGKGLEEVGRLERIKRDRGINDREERSSGIEILMVDAFAKSKPSDPLRLDKQATRRKQNGSDSSGSSLARAHASHVSHHFMGENRRVSIVSARTRVKVLNTSSRNSFLCLKS
jgi:hypothetical protein